MSDELQATAYHEAGHAVAANWERVRIGSATIVPTDDYAGCVETRDMLHGRDVEVETGSRNRDRMERMVRVKFAGFAAQRRFDEAGAKDWHASHDYQGAVALASYFTGTTRELEAYLNLLLVQAEEFFNRPGVWEQVTAVAEALLAKQTLKPTEIRAVMRGAFQRCLEDSAPMTTPREGGTDGDRPETHMA